jgi:hypothetical protein
VYAKAGLALTEPQIVDLASAKDVEESWWQKWKIEVPVALRNESRRTGEVATYSDTGFALSAPLQPNAWGKRLEYLKKQGRKLTRRKSGKIPYLRK